MSKRVAVLGGGVAGLSAAHELGERGFDVVVFEKQPVIAGGKARSLPVPHSGVGGLADLPAEHGFHFFPGFYRHLPDTMKRIPYRGRTVFNHLVDTDEVQLARYGGQALRGPTHFPLTLADLHRAFEFLVGFGKIFAIPNRDVIFFVERLLVLMTSCEERRFAEYEIESWWDFVDADNRSPNFRKYLADKLSRNLVAAQPKMISARTGGYMLLQFLYDFSTPGGNAVDRVLNGPANDVWIDPWLAHLNLNPKVDYQLGTEVTSIQCRGQRITGVTVKTANGSKLKVVADYYISALPLEVFMPLVTQAMTDADPQLKNLAALTHAAMNGILFYLNRDVPVIRGHTNYCDAPWALTSISQPQFWPGVKLDGYGDGTVRGILSCIISDWNTPGTMIPKPANQCTAQEIGEEVWYQLKEHLNTGGTTVLRDSDKVGVPFLPPSIVFDAPAKPRTVEPLFINTKGSWALRPEAITLIENFFLASDFVRTYTDLATMEGANEAARRAVNGILKKSQSPEPPCDVWPLREPQIFALEREIDLIRFRLGLPHLLKRELKMRVVKRLYKTRRRSK